MIQAIMVFNNHGKPRLVRFYQRFVSAAQLRYVPSGRPHPIPSLRPRRRTRVPPAPCIPSCSLKSVRSAPRPLLSLTPSWTLAFLCHLVTHILGSQGARY